MSDAFKQRMRNIGGSNRPSSATTFVEDARGQQVVTVPLAAIAPDPYQVRFLPKPADLIEAEGDGDEDARELLHDLRALGESLRQQQIHPLLVYPVIEIDPEYPEAEWRILSGERRWRAAVLTGLPSLQVIQLSRRPSDSDRLIFQYVENEARSALSDLDRAEAAQRLKDQLEHEAGKSVPWGEVEGRLSLGESRRIQLMRLYDRLPVESRPLVRRYRWQERTLRPLHNALNDRRLTPEQAQHFLLGLEIRSRRGEDITGTLVGKLVLDLERQGYQGETWLDEERERLQRMTTQGKMLLRRDLSQISQQGREALKRDLEVLRGVISDVERSLGV